MLGGDASLKIDQVGIPKNIFKALTKLMVVNSLNYGLEEKLVREKKLNYVMKKQPALHQSSMMGFRVVPQDVKTFKVSLAVTKPLNPDFDGDEMNCHVPRNSMTTAEAKELRATPFHILSPKNGMPIICIVQDAMVSMYLLTKRKKQIERSMLMQYLEDVDDLSRFNEIVSKLGNTGKALFSFLLPRQLWHQMSKKRVENGLLMDGIIDKSSLRSSSSSLIKCIFDDYGAQRAAQFIDECPFLAKRYILYTGCCIGIVDCVVIPRKVVKSIVDKEFLKVNSLDPDVAVEDVENNVMNMSRQQLSQNDNSGFMISVESGAKVSLFNVCQMTGLLGQQCMNGKSLTDGIPQRTIFDQGFAIGSFGSRLSPKEFFSHARARRMSLCDTALTTSQTEYSQRKLIKFMKKNSCSQSWKREMRVLKEGLQRSIWRRWNRPM